MKRNLLLIISLLLLLISCSEKKDQVDPKAEIVGNWEVVSGTLDCFEKDVMQETYTRTAISSTIEFREDYTYISSDEEGMQPFGQLGNPSFSQYFLEGGMWEPIIDSKYLYLDKGVNELNSDPYAILEIKEITNTDLKLKWRIDQTEFPKNRKAFRFAGQKGFRDGINLFTVFDTTSNDACFDIGYMMARSFGFYSTDTSDRSANYGYWLGVYSGYVQVTAGKSPRVDYWIGQGYNQGYPVGVQKGEEVGTPHNLERIYEFHFHLKKVN